MTGPLNGIKIVEMAEYVAMPSAMVILSDWGADVIKIENTKGGDGLRGLRAIEGRAAKDILPWWEQTNRNKRSIAIDLWKEEGREIVFNLVRKSDVFVSNFTLPVINRFHMDYETLRDLNPRLIYAHLTGFGKLGPDKEKPGFDYIAFWARSGIMASLGEPGTPPPPQRAALGDNLTSGFIAGAISAALYEREKTGVGQAIDFSLYSYGVWGLGMDLSMTLIQGEELPRTSRNNVSNPLWNTYQTKDGVWIQVMCLQSDRYWPQFCKGLDMENLIDDPRFESHNKREQNNSELIALIASAISNKTYIEIEEGFQRAGEVIYGRIQSPLEVVKDPQALENDFFPEIEHQSGQKIRLIASPAKFSRTPASIKGAAPELGQHTEEVLLEIGYTWDDIIHLKDNSAIL